MFGLSWAETFVIAIIALVVIGPKDLPPIIKAGKKLLGKFKSIQQEIRTSINDIVSEAELENATKDLKEEAEAINDEINTIVDMYGKEQPTYDLSDIQPDIKKDDDTKGDDV